MCIRDRAMITAPLDPNSSRPMIKVQPVTPQTTISGRAYRLSTVVATRSAPSKDTIDQMPAPVRAIPGSSVAHGDQPLSSTAANSSAAPVDAQTMSQVSGWVFNTASKIRNPNSPTRYRPPATSSAPRTALITAARVRALVRLPAAGAGVAALAVSAVSAPAGWYTVGSAEAYVPSE